MTRANVTFVGGSDMSENAGHQHKGGNTGGSRTHASSNDGARQSDRFPTIENQDEGSDEEEPVPADEIAANDPHKVEKLAKQGRENFDPDAGSD